MNIVTLDNAFIAGTYARFNLVAERGEGAKIYGADGKAYIDLGSGIGVNAFGAADPVWLEAVTAQLHKLQHLSNLYYTEPQTALAKLLCERTGMKKVFFCNSGTEANECAIKCARKYSHDKYGEGRHTIITLEGSFHGRTLAALSATGQEKLREDFLPALPGFVHVPADDILTMRGAMDADGVCAVMLELIQGEGGVIPLSREFVLEIEKLALERDILLIIDEVQTGNGRTGHLYSYMSYGVSPDIVTTAKGLGGGLPIGASMFGSKVSETLGPGSHGSTFGGNPVCAAGAVSIISRLTDEFLRQVQEKGKYVKDELEGASGAGEVMGLGLMLGIKTKKPAKDIAEMCLDKGVIVLTAKEKVRLLPPINIDWALLREGISILKEVIAI